MVCTWMDYALFFYVTLFSANSLLFAQPKMLHYEKPYKYTRFSCAYLLLESLTVFSTKVAVEYLC